MNMQRQNPAPASQGFGNRMQNISRKGINTYNKSSGLGKIIFFIVLVLFIVLLIYIVYAAVMAAQSASANSPVIVNDVIDAYQQRPPFKLPQVTQGMNQSFSTWIYVKDWNYKFGQYKNILWKGNPTSTSTGANSGPTASSVHSPSLWLYPLTNSLKVVTSTSAPAGVESCDIQNIPLMAWVHIVYVLNNRTVDIYLNGKLERSCALQGIPNITNDPVYLTTGTPLPGFYGKLGKTIYYTKPLLPNEVANLYQQGPLGSSQYQVSFFQDGKFMSFKSTSSYATMNNPNNES